MSPRRRCRWFVVSVSSFSHFSLFCCCFLQSFMVVSSGCLVVASLVCQSFHSVDVFVGLFRASSLATVFFFFLMVSFCFEEAIFRCLL